MAEDEQILKKILEDTYTLASLKKRVRNLKHKLSQEYYEPENEQSSSANKEEIEDEWLKSQDKSFYSLFNKGNFDQIFASLEKKITSIQILVVYLAFFPAEMQIIEISKWVRTQIQPDILLDIKLNGELIGGCAFIWNGVYHDYSLKSKIELNKDKILSGFKEFLKK